MSHEGMCISYSLISKVSTSPFSNSPHKFGAPYLISFYYMMKNVRNTLLSEVVVEATHLVKEPCLPSKWRCNIVQIGGEEAHVAW